MRSVDFAVDHRRAVEVDERILIRVTRPLPAIHLATRALVVLGDDLVVDRVEVTPIDAHALVGLGHVEASHLAERAHPIGRHARATGDGFRVVKTHQSRASGSDSQNVCAYSNFAGGRRHHFPRSSSGRR